MRSFARPEILPSPPADPASSDRLQVRAERTTREHTLYLGGQLDLATCSIFDRAIHDSLSEAPAVLRVELDGLEFMDSTGLRSVLGAVSSCAQAEVRLDLTRGSDQVQRLFELTDLAERLPFVS